MPALPLALVLVILYYSSGTSEQIAFWPYPYAPTLVQQPIELMYAVTYAVVSAAAAWQGARLKEAGVWQAAPFRPAWQIIALALVPVVALGWLMFITPVVMAFVQIPTWPTLDSLPPLLLGMALCCAHALIGFSIGRWIRPIIAAPTLMCLVFVIVAFPHSMNPPWLRHIMGEYSAQLGFGETATFVSMVAQLLPTGGVAVAVALIWIGRWHIAVRAGLGTALALASVTGAYAITANWNFNPSLNAGQVTVVCSGKAPEVCMPEQAGDDLAVVSAEVRTTYAQLKTYGVVKDVPDTVRDSIIYGRFEPKPSTTTAYIPLSLAHKNDAVVATIVDGTPKFGCDATPEAIITVNMWLAGRLGRAISFESIASGNPFYTRSQHDKIAKAVDEVSRKPVDEQRAWYRQMLKDGCEGAAP
ncbi:hypothetical protein [Streptomyces blattellae]|uniref:hypothetical protein n=1 Tax=Streptomyces blattellae TaxID=2569855 RepID=UPI0012BA0A54|nr:hypothetical protein [Streptomyces blattellae]